MLRVVSDTESGSSASFVSDTARAVSSLATPSPVSDTP
jgi:hypothetical protein